MDKKYILDGYKLLNLKSKFQEPYTNASDYAEKLVSMKQSKQSLCIRRYTCLEKR